MTGLSAQPALRSVVASAWLMTWSATLCWAAWSDWTTRRVPWPVMWGLYGWGLGAAALNGHSVIALAAGTAGLLSSLPIPGRLWLAAGALGLSLGWPVASEAIPVGLICLFWLAFEQRWIGGADATLAIGLLAGFASLRFTGLLIMVWAVGGGLAWLSRRWTGREAPLVVALALAGLAYGWAPGGFVR